MTQFEEMSLLILGASLLISLWALRSSQRINKEQLDLQRTMARLAERQLEQLEAPPPVNAAHQVRSEVPRLRISLRPHGRNSHKFFVSNVGEAPARNVSFTLHPHGKGDNPMIESDYKEKFPVPVLSPGAEVGVLAGFTFGSASAFDVKLRWEKENGSVAEEETFVAL